MPGIQIRCLPSWMLVASPCRGRLFASPGQAATTRAWPRAPRDKKLLGQPSLSSSSSRGPPSIFSRKSPHGLVASRRNHTENRTASPGTKNIDVMSSELIPSNPEEVMVVRQITPNVHTFSVPFARYGRFKVGGRGSLVKLTSGNLAVFSPTALTEAAKAKVAEQGGNVGYIVALDYEHHIFISEWAKQYPNAKIVGPDGLPEKRQQATDPKIGKEPFAVEFKKANKRSIRISEEIDADFDYEYMDGHANKEIVFNYRPDKVLIQADLMFNLPATEQYSKVPQSQMPRDGILDRIFTGIQNATGEATWIRRFNWYLGRRDKESYHESIKTIDKWDFNTIIPCHGETIVGNGKEVFRKVFAFDLEGKH